MPELLDNEPHGIGFYGGPFSNFAHSPITLPAPGGILFTYPTVEHRFQAMKAERHERHMEIALAETPGAAKAAGRRAALRPDWEQVKMRVMFEALREKFKIPGFRQELLATGHAYLYERSPHDGIWGAYNPQRGNWSGQNLLGVALMVVRAEIMGER